VARMKTIASKSRRSVRTTTLAEPSLERLMYSVPETARVLGVSVWTVYRLLARGALSASPWFRCKRIPRAQVLSLAEEGGSHD